MQKDDKSYAFLLSHSSKSGIYIKRVQFSKRYLHSGSVGTLFVIALVTLAFGFKGLVNETSIAQAISQTSVVTKIAAEPIRESAAGLTSADITINTGGPEEDGTIDGENVEIENQLRTVRSTSDPSSLPTMWAHVGKINNEFGFRRNPFGGRAYEFHAGMDIDGERGDLIVAPANGTVIKAGMTGGYGNMVEIDHGNGLTTRYGHMSKIEAAVGDVITRGQLIGYAGSTGRSTGPHLHFELRLNDKPINPRHFLPQEPADLTNIPK